jgi:hypothetical protein
MRGSGRFFESGRHAAKNKTAPGEGRGQLGSFSICGSGYLTTSSQPFQLSPLVFTKR